MTIMIPAWVDGVLTPVEKLDAHLKGLRHRAVSVFVTRGDQVLLQRRALGKYHTPGLWANTCCTHPNWDESPLACAKRRLDEELGVTGLDLHYRDTVEYRAAVGDEMIEHEVVDIFVGEAGADLRIDPNPSEVMDWAWCPIDALAAQVARAPKAYTPWLKIYLADHASTIFGTRDSRISVA